MLGVLKGWRILYDADADANADANADADADADAEPPVWTRWRHCWASATSWWGCE